MNINFSFEPGQLVKLVEGSRVGKVERIVVDANGVWYDVRLQENERLYAYSPEELVSA